ncbi:unnamed protein product [Sphagnum troendelagicum]|uniref:LysM domain-containing protein n=1 Tax=Sphagnum troendelagicum TaxID=128251 RepID=A0ABP0TYS6_9BRYO
MAARLSPSSSIDDATSTSGSSSSSIGYMEHTVSKLDTLAGVAIKYGVEVADIKRLNALTTDYQMYALKTLRIPLQGKHSPSAAAHKNSSGLTRYGSSSVDRGLQYLASASQSTSNNGIRYRSPEKRAPTSAMGLLRGYYGLASMTGAGAEGTEMDVYKTDAEFLYEYQPHLNALWSSPTPEKHASDSCLLMTPSKDPLPNGEIEVVNEAAERQMNGRSVRRRSKNEMGSDEVMNVRERVTLLMKGSASRPKEPTANLPLPRPGLSTFSNGSQNSSDGVGASSGMKASGAAVRGSKGAADSLISKVRRSAGATSLQEVRSIVTASPSVLSPALPGPSSVLEGLTSAVRRSKAALD